MEENKFMSKKDWPPTCEEVQRRIWIDTWELEKDLPAKIITLPPDGDTSISSQIVTDGRTVPLTKELWLALLLARARTGNENGWMTGQNNETGKFILEYIKEK